MMPEGLRKILPDQIKMGRHLGGHGFNMYAVDEGTLFALTDGPLPSLAEAAIKAVADKTILERNHHNPGEVRVGVEGPRGGYTNYNGGLVPTNSVWYEVPQHEADSIVLTSIHQGFSFERMRAR